MRRILAEKITPCLWFDDDAEAAARFYVSIFARSKILATSRYGRGGPRPEGSVAMRKLDLAVMKRAYAGPAAKSPKPQKPRRR